MDETAESVPAPNAGSSRNRLMSTSDLDTPGRPEREASVWPLVFVVPHIFLEDNFKVASTPDQHPVQALLPHGSYPPLDRACVPRLDRRVMVRMPSAAKTLSNARVNLLWRCCIAATQGMPKP